MKSSADILDLFRETGIDNPTDIQIQNVVALLERTIEDKKNFLKAGMKKAESIKRWRGFENKMKIIDTVWEHQNRVRNMIPISQDIIVSAFWGFDFKKACFMASHHDMTEWLSPFGDIPTPLKLKLSPKLASLLKEVEMACLEILATMDGSDYDMNHSNIRDALLEMENKETPEAQVVKYFDLLDAYMISIHEYSLWTMEFLDRVEWYSSVFQKIHTGNYLPFLKELQNWIYIQSNNHPTVYSILDTKTLSTLEINPKGLITGVAYNFWKEHIAVI